MTGQRTIVIVTEEFDPHADALLLLLREMGHRPLRLHAGDFPGYNSLNVELDGTGWSGHINARGTRLPIEDIQSVLWRRPGPYGLPSDLGSEEGDFVRLEWRHALRGLWYSLDCYWMSFPFSIEQAGYKPEQLVRAAKLGLMTPRTLVSNEPDKIRAFYDDCDGSIIYKPVSYCVYTTGNSEGGKPRNKSVYATPIGPEELAVLHKITLTPGVFQENVRKQIELRVTIIGDEIFTAEIDSQAQERTKQDWRHYDVPMLISESTLPDDIASRCFQLVRSYGLNFGAIDLILTPDGRYIFLEINPNGQWLWVQEHLPQLKMKEAMAACLIRGNSQASI